jgi:hypothetical protein
MCVKNVCVEPSQSPTYCSLLPVIESRLERRCPQALAWSPQVGAQAHFLGTLAPGPGVATLALRTAREIALEPHLSNTCVESVPVNVHFVPSPGLLFDLVSLVSLVIIIYIVSVYLCSLI